MSTFPLNIPIFGCFIRPLLETILGLVQYLREFHNLWNSQTFPKKAAADSGILIYMYIQCIFLYSFCFNLI